MAGIHMMMLGSGGPRFASSLSATLEDTTADAPAPLQVSIELRPDGTVGYAGGSSNGAGTWVSPAVAGVGNPYWVRLNVSGANRTDYAGNTPGVWYPLSANQVWAFRNSRNYWEGTGSFNFSIATDSGGANIIATIEGGSWSVGYIV